MHVVDSPAEAAFRAELRSWCEPVVAALAPRPDPDDWPARRAFDAGWQRQLQAAGYAGINWPAEFGGRGADLGQQLIFLEEMERAGAPQPGVCYVALNHAGPTIMVEGSAAQRARHLPRILSGEEIWCQGFSEPGSGSDLASLTTRARQNGEEYVVSGRKIWTSNAHVADFCEVLVRTGPPDSKHAGISWLILPMSAPGIEVRPLRTIAGSTEFCELILDDVRVPVANRVGAENDGWRVANVTLSFERGTGLIRDILHAREVASQLAALARQTAREAGEAEAEGLHAETGRLLADFDAIWALALRNVSIARRDGQAGTAGSALKVYVADTLHQLGDLAMRILGRAGLSLDELTADGTAGPASPYLDAHFFAFIVSIAGGTSQIQRNIVAERGLGLPREPRWTSP
jgi:alkylation response protein AidB-like acyl-CoA dehydrogenase